MTKETDSQTQYRAVTLPGLGRVQVPAHLSDTEALEMIGMADSPRSAPKKSKKKP